MSASGIVEKAGEPRPDILCIRGRQIPQARSPQTRTMGGGKRVFAGDGGYGSRGVDRRRRIPGREAIYRVDEGPNAVRKRARVTMAPLNNRTIQSTYPVGNRNSHS